MNDKQPCFVCEDGHYEPVNQTYEALVWDKNGNVLSTMKVPNIDVLTCGKCGDEMLDSENLEKIDKYRLNNRIK